MSLRRKQVPIRPQAGDDQPPPYSSVAPASVDGEWVSLNNDISIWSMPGLPAGDHGSHVQVTAPQARANSYDIGRTDGPAVRGRQTYRHAIADSEYQRAAPTTNDRGYYQRSDRATPVELDAGQRPNTSIRPLSGVGTSVGGISQAERMQDIRYDYHNAASAHVTRGSASPTDEPSPSTSSSSSTQSQEIAESSTTYVDTDRDYALALALQHEENERAHDTSVWEQEDRHAEAFLHDRYNDGDDDDQNDMTAHDAELAAQVHDEEEAQRMSLSTPQLRTCAICSEDAHPLDFPARPPSSSCTHRVNTCTSCLEKWVAADLVGRGWQRISCPECRSPLRHADVRRAATAAVFERYDALATGAALGADAAFHWCIAPACGSGQVHDDAGGAAPVFECAACGLRQCVAHAAAWHEGETCAEYDDRVSGRAERERRAREDEASEATASATTQTCPRPTCRARIEKRAGCDHMLCSRCGTQFCYVCGADYTDIARDRNRGHKSTCKYYSGGYPH